MFFNSIDFAIFLPIVFLLYWFFTFKSTRAQNLLLLVASYVFYGWWDWRFLFLVAFSSLVDYLIGIGLKRNEVKRQRQVLLCTSIFVNLGFLGLFKYYNFFLDSFVGAFNMFGATINPQGLNFILPVGISFYTFQTLSYSIDVYRKKIEPTNDFIEFAAFVSFFPQLVAGPIERASNLLPQFKCKRVFEYDKAVNGMRQILWGLFKKIVIADNCAQYANEIFNNQSNYSGSTLCLGVFYFSFQIYGDFSGYSDIAIGTSRLFGFQLKKNFAYPYFSRDIAEFWRRWHISLSTWFRDYVYIPLGGSQVSNWKKTRNVFIVFVVSGFWHGSNWTFIAWGILNAIYFLPLLLLNRNRKNVNGIAQNKYIPGIFDIARITSTFCLVSFSWIFFRSRSITDALNFISGIFSVSLFSLPSINGGRYEIATIFLLLAFLVIEWLGRERDHPLARCELSFPKPVRWCIYLAFILAIYFFGNFSESIEFIYFQF